MSELITPTGYESRLGIYETQTAIGMLKRHFEQELMTNLNLKRVSAPLFVPSGKGLNDDLNGHERPVEFDIPETGSEAQVVHSLAKRKRMALKKYGFPVGEGLYTDMNAIRRDEKMDNLHSIYVDQRDRERVITCSERTLPFLKDIVSKIVSGIVDTQEFLREQFPVLKSEKPLSREVSFVTAQELKEIYPDLTDKERENAYVKEHPTTFIIGISESRAPDYDDRTLNGDIMFWSEVLQCAIEISSMGIRVDEKSLAEQLKKSGLESRSTLEYHAALLAGELPLTIGGGIGQSRLSMLLLGKAHVGEVQVSIWDDATREGCAKSGITLL